MFIYLKLFHITLSKLFHICSGWDILLLTDASACPNLLLYQDTILLTSLKYTKVLYKFLFLILSDVHRKAHKKGPQGFIKNPLVLLFSELFFFLLMMLGAKGILPPTDTCALFRALHPLLSVRSSMPSKFCSRSHDSYKSDGPVCAAAYKIHRDIHSVPGVFRPARSTVQRYKHCRCESFHQTPRAL